MTSQWWQTVLMMGKSAAFVLPIVIDHIIINLILLMLLQCDSRSKLQQSRENIKAMMVVYMHESLLIAMEYMEVYVLKQEALNLSLPPALSHS